MTKPLDHRIILFVFAGRQPNMELQLPLVQRILEEHPHVEYHCWNFARNEQDRAYVKSISGPQITVINDHGSMAHDKAYRYYTQPQFRDCLFIKMDDDVVFLETGRFSKFIAAIDAHRGSIVSAHTINNGASTPIEPGVWEGFNELGMHLLDIHLSSEFADMAHTYFFDHDAEVLNAPIKLIPTEDWLSINIVGYDWETLCRVVNTRGTPHPAVVADRPMKGWGGPPGPGKPFGVFGDEGVCNVMPRIIMRGFTAAHLTYGPQNATEEQLARWREGYRQLGERYLSAAPTRNGGRLPALSPVSHAQKPYHTQSHDYDDVVAKWGPDNWRSRWVGENDPTVGRYRP